MILSESCRVSTRSMSMTEIRIRVDGPSSSDLAPLSSVSSYKLYSCRNSLLTYTLQLYEFLLQIAIE